jgi:long-chain acyl-CoA synthetase
MELTTLIDLLEPMRRLGGREAIGFNNGYRTAALSYADLYRRIAGCTQGLAGAGLVKGDRLLLWGANRPEWAIAFWAAVALGVEVVPLDAASSTRFVSRIAEQTRPKLLVHDEAHQAEEIPIPKLSFAEISKLKPSSTLLLAEIVPEDIVEIVFTSGTTGEPKGVVHKHKNICSNLRPLGREIDRYLPLIAPLQPLRILSLLPLSHMFGQALGLFIPLLLHGQAVFMAEYSPKAILWVVRKEGITALVAVPRLLEQLQLHLRSVYGIAGSGASPQGWVGFLAGWLRHKRVHAITGLRFWALVVGGARLERDLEEWWRELGFLVVQGYGLTEASPVVSVNHPLQGRRGSLGRALQGQEVALAEDGEILVRGDNVVQGYFGQAQSEGTAGQEWLHTGDIGAFDAEGRLYYKGRKKDVIVTAEGYNIYPEDVENVLRSFPEVAECAVVGLEGRGGSEVHAVLIPMDRSSDLSRVIGKANERLESHQRIKGWSLWPENDFPRTPSTLKIKRSEIARRLGSSRAAAPQAEPSSETGDLEAIVARLARKPREEIRSADLLEDDLGFTSLDRIELLAALEEAYSLQLSEEELKAVHSVQDLSDLVERLQKPRAVPEAAPSSGAAFPPPPSDRPPPSSPEPAVEGAVRHFRRAWSPPRWNRSRWLRLVRFVFQNALLVPGFRMAFRPKARGLLKLRHAPFPVLFAANHTSHWDTVAVVSALPLCWRRRIAPAMLQDVFAPWFEPAKASKAARAWSGLQYGLACGLFNAYPLPQRMGGVREALRYTGELLDIGCCPLVFPEGERSPDGRLQDFKPGIGMMARNLGAAVVPVHLAGLYRLLRRSKGSVPSSDVVVSFGRALEPEPGEAEAAFAARVRDGVQALSEEPDASSEGEGPNSAGG